MDANGWQLPEAFQDGRRWLGILAATKPNHKSPSAIKLPKTWFNEREKVYNLNFSILLSMVVYDKMTHIAAASAGITVATSSSSITFYQCPFSLELEPRCH